MTALSSCLQYGLLLNSLHPECKMSMQYHEKLRMTLLNYWQISY